MCAYYLRMRYNIIAYKVTINMICEINKMIRAKYVFEIIFSVMTGTRVYGVKCTTWFDISNTKHVT